MSETLIKVENVSKIFCRDLKRSLWYGMKDLGSELLGRSHNNNGPLRKDEFWAVRDISFELKRGECLGLIGPNGAGKTTLLRMLNGLIKPDKGRIEMHGRVGALIALGAGFNPILTGRENIYVNASVLGLSQKEIDAKFDDIVDFSEIREFIDMPVQSYSSGMAMRLGFAVATSLSPDILIIDEILAVGDMGFRSKCYDVMSQMRQKASIIFVSHSMPMVARMCEYSLTMNKGKKHFFGKTSEAIIKYYNLFEGKRGNDRTGTGEAHVEQINFSCININDRPVINYGDELNIKILITANLDIPDLIVNLVFRDLSDNVIAECSNYINPIQIIIRKGESIQVQTSIKEFTLNPGIYHFDIILMSKDMIRHYDWLRPARVIEVRGPRIATGGQQFKAIWSFS
jgi:lipopolysaccharide transport system ATP-binding protein